MQGGRLFKILYELLERGQATAPELAKKYEVSVRTIYRDIDALGSAGIPIYAKTGRNGGIYLLPEFVLDKALLSKEEKQDILAAVQSIAAVGTTDENSVLSKLSAVFQIPSERWLEVDFSRWGTQEADNDKFKVLKDAILAHKCVSISYVGSEQKTSERKIQPAKLLYRGRGWYVQAYCLEKKELRLFKLNRIRQLKPLEESFLSIPFWEQQEEERVNYPVITLRFLKEAACRAYDEFDESQMQLQDNGDIIVSAQMPEDSWLLGYLLSMGTGVEVLEPKHIKAILAQEAKKIYEKNKT